MSYRRNAYRKSRPRQLASKKFTRVFNDARTIIQRQIVEKALIPCLDAVPQKDAKRAIATAKSIAKKFEKIPIVDMAAKKAEISVLLDELAKDAKLASRSRTSKYEVLLLEIVDSVAEWLNDLWSLTFEFGLDFPRAHTCLLSSMGVLDHLQGMKSSGCRCHLTTIYVPITIRDTSGKVIKEFSELGLSNIETAVLWVWRELFLALLASNDPLLIKLVPELLSEIDDIIGWSGLERLFLGGMTISSFRHRLMEFVRQLHFRQALENHCDEQCKICSQDEEFSWRSYSGVEDVDVDDILYEEHWTYKIIRQVPCLNRLVQARMLEIFRAIPSLQLYHSMTTVATDRSAMDELHDILSRLATTSATSLSAALEIYAVESRPEEIAPLLETHAFLLRPRDYEVLQEAIRSLASSDNRSHRTLALHIAKKELLDSVETIIHALRSPFSRIDSPSQRDELQRIIKLPRGSDERRERIENWVQASSTPGMGPANPMAFAAMMMGMPIAIPVPNAGPGDEEAGGAENIEAAAAAAIDAALDAEDAEHLGLMNLDSHDPDFVDLREQHSPDLKGRFEGWVDLIMSTEFQNAVDAIDEDQKSKECGENGRSGGSSKNVERRKETTNGVEEVMETVYMRICEVIPWINWSDIVDELIARIADKPSKHHICDALEILTTFAKLQRRKSRRKRRVRAMRATLPEMNSFFVSASSSASASTSTSTSTSGAGSGAVPTGEGNAEPQIGTQTQTHPIDTPETPTAERDAADAHTSNELQNANPHEYWNDGELFVDTEDEESVGDLEPEAGVEVNHVGVQVDDLDEENEPPPFEATEAEPVPIIAANPSFDDGDEPPPLGLVVDLESGLIVLPLPDNPFFSNTVTQLGDAEDDEPPPLEPVVGHQDEAEPAVLPAPTTMPFYNIVDGGIEDLD